MTGIPLRIHGRACGYGGRHDLARMPAHRCAHLHMGNAVEVADCVSAAVGGGVTRIAGPYSVDMLR